jgi:DNA uptake protein ComE-like DNA-binding protein
MDLKKAVEDIKGIASDARDLAEAFRKALKDDPEAETTAKQRAELTRLITEAEKTRTALRAAAKAERAQRIAELKEHVRDIKMSVGTPGLTAEAQDRLDDLLNVNQAELARLQSLDATDFSGLLPPEEFEEIAKLLEAAKREVQQKRRVAQALAIAVQAADVALTVAGKLAKAAI